VQRGEDQLIAVQVKLITQDGRKVEGSHPDTVGNLGDGAVRLGPASAIMGIAEGVETALSAMAMADMPVWASIGSKRLHRVELPEIVQEVHIFCDNDKPGHEAAQRAADVHVKARRRVYMRFPPADLNDYNDFLLALADRSAAA
jgi:putative DNA primase/helicase